MTNIQRMKSDIETIERREMRDRALSNNRDRNDGLTQERRFKADKLMSENRMRNDEMTANRRETKDENPSMILALFLLIFTFLVIGAFFVLI